jgi:Recombination endonuclease VII
MNTLETSIVALKTCPSCKVEKSLFDFAIRQSGPKTGQAVTYCKICNLEKQKERKERDPSIYRRIEWPSKLKNKYGITVNDYYRMLEEQGGGCGICGTKVPSSRKRKYVAQEMFFVDHSHSTGKVRGLLCGKCNRGLGYFEDEPERLEEAANYLRRSS